MVYKVLNEDGAWKDAITGERRNLLEANTAWTPEGINVGWTEFSSIEAAAESFGLVPYEENTEDLENG